MYIEELLPQVLQHVDRRRWQRQAALLELIARNTYEHGAFVLSVEVLADLGRTPPQADYDRRVLGQLADDDVLRRWRGGGRCADAWQLRPRFDRWKHVPWLTPQRQVWRDLSKRLTVDSAHLYAKSPGQRVFLIGVGSPIEEVLTSLTRTFAAAEPRTSVQRPRTSARSEHEEGSGTTDNCAGDEAGVSMLLGLENPPSLTLPSSQGVGARARQGMREGDLAHTAEALALIEHVMQLWHLTWLANSFQERLGVVAHRWGPDQASLHRRCDDLAAGGLASWTLAISHIESWTPGAAATPERTRYALAARAEVLRSLIPTREQYGDDTTELRDELASILNEIGDPA